VNEITWVFFFTNAWISSDSYISALANVITIQRHISKFDRCKNRRPYNLYCVGADVKPCSINLDRCRTSTMIISSTRWKTFCLIRPRCCVASMHLENSLTYLLSYSPAAIVREYVFTFFSKCKKSWLFTFLCKKSWLFTFFAMFCTFSRTMFGTKPLSSTVSDNQWRMWRNGWYDLKRPLNKGHGHSFWYQPIPHVLYFLYRLSIVTIAVGVT